MSFFSAFFGTCRGSYVFETLRQHSWFRVIWHLLLLAVCCAFLIGLGQYFSLQYLWRGARSQFLDIFGEELYFTERGILPGKDQETGRCQELPYNGLLIYAAKNGQKNYSNETLRDRNFILLWSSANIALSVRSKNNLWLTIKRGPQSMLDFDTPQKPEKFEKMRSNLMEMINAAPSNNWQFPNVPEYIPVYRIYDYLRAVMASSTALAYFFRMLFLMVIGTGVFTLLHRLFSRNSRKMVLSASEQWKVSIYAAFPVIFVLGAFPMLQLPMMQFYDTFFVIGWVIYLLVTLHYLETLHSEPATNNGEAAESTPGENDDEQQ